MNANIRGGEVNIRGSNAAWRAGKGRVVRRKSLISRIKPGERFSPRNSGGSELGFTGGNGGNRETAGFGAALSECGLGLRLR